MLFPHTQESLHTLWFVHNRTPSFPFELRHLTFDSFRQVFVFVFLNGFSTLWQYPATLTSMVIVSIAGQPGLSVGACWSNGWLGMAGVGIGAGFYAILAKLGEHNPSARLTSLGHSHTPLDPGHSRVAQG